MADEMATPGQCAQVLHLLSQRQVPREQMTRLFDSGILSDVLDANLDMVDRDDLRRALGLNPELPPLVVDPSTIGPAPKDRPTDPDLYRVDQEIELESTPYTFQPIGARINPAKELTFNELVERAANKGALLNQEHAELLLHAIARADQHRWVDYSFLFPGTRWRSRRPGRMDLIPVLRCRGYRAWILHYVSADTIIGAKDRLVRIVP